MTWLADAFTSYSEASIGRAAIKPLERAGWTVELADGGSRGRAAFSKVLLDQARRRWSTRWPAAPARWSETSRPVS